MPGIITAKPLAFGQLPAAKGTLYLAPEDVIVSLAALILLVNVSGADVQVNIYFTRGSDSVRIFPKDASIIAKDNLVYGAPLPKSSISLGPGDKIEGEASAAAAVDFYISGVEER